MSNIYKKKSIYFPNLDALRFLAFLVVFINHVVATLGHRTSNATISKIKSHYLLNGDLGVNFFFVLSGFLITFLLIREKDFTKTIAVGKFYLKRILRIWPVYFLVLFIGLVIVPMFAVPQNFPILTYTHIMNKSLFYFFLGNFDYVYNGISNAVVGILWSVSVEEQFYLFWPLVLLIIPKKHLLKVFIGLILFGTYYRMYGTAGRSLNLMQLYHTFSSVSDLATGALVAYLCTYEKFIEFFKKLSPIVIAIVYIVGFTLLAFRFDILHLDLSHNDYLKEIQYRGKAPYPRPHQIWHSIMPVVFSFFFAFILMEQVFSERSFFKVGKIKTFTYLGKISYGLYSYHMVAMFFVVYFSMKMGFNATRPDKFLVIFEALSAFSLTILISWLSYNFWEKRFLTIKEKLTGDKAVSKIIKKETRQERRKQKRKKK